MDEQPPAPNTPSHELPFHLRRRLGLLGQAGLHDLELAHAHVPAWLRATEAEHCFPVAAAVSVAIGLQLSLAPELSPHPRWLLPALELVFLLVLVAANPGRLRVERRFLRASSIALTAAISLGNGLSAALLADHVLTGKATSDARSLMLAGGSIYLTNVIAFGLWYWEHDRGGPFARAHGRRHHPDLLFPQMAAPEISDPDWEPRFVDYLYLSFTNATAFSPTDTLPLSRWAKLLMATQSAVSLITVALVVSRAVNILK